MPDAATLAGYKGVDERLIDEVLEGAKENRRHRMSMDRMLSNTARLSLMISGALVAMAIVAAVVITLSGYPWVGGFFGAGGLAVIVGTLIKGGGIWSGKGDGESGKGDHQT